MSVTELSLEQPVRPSRAAGPLVRFIGVALAAAVVVSGVLVARGWRPFAALQRAADPAAVSAGLPASAAVEDRFGIRLTAAAITAGNGMVQLRYQVLDPQKALALHDASPVVVRSDGTVFDAPGIPGHSHSKNSLDAGRAGYVLLANSNGGIRRGMVVTIKIGDLLVKDVTIA